MKILSLNGGGTVIYLHSRILALFEEEHGVQVSDLFDRVYGVSAGAIGGGMLSLGYSAGFINKECKQLCKDLFGHRKLTSYLPWNPYYDADRLDEILTQYFKDKTFSNTQTDFACHAIDITQGRRIQPKFWKSWDSRDKDIKLKDAIRASASAPTYFKPHTINGITYIDGGLVTNNPSMCAIADALAAGEVLPSIYVLNLQDGITNGFKHAEKKDSLVDWITNVYTVAVSSVDRMVEYQAHELLKFNNHVILPDKDLPLDSLDFDTMNKQAESLYKEHRDHLKTVLLSK